MQPHQRSWTRRLVLLVVAGGLFGAGLGFLASSRIVPGYDASAFLLITPAGTAPVEANEVQYAQAISQVVTHPAVLAAGGDTSALPEDRAQVRADPSPNAPLIEIVVNAGTARAAQRSAQAAADAVVDYTADRVNVLGFRAVVLAPAAPGEPAGLSPIAYVVAGAVMGVVLGGLAALLWGVPAAVGVASETRAADDAVLHNQPTTVASP